MSIVDVQLTDAVIIPDQVVDNTQSLSKTRSAPAIVDASGNRIVLTED